MKKIMKDRQKPHHLRVITFESIPAEWIFQDYTMGHSILLYILLTISSLFQIVGFFASEFYIGFIQINSHKTRIQDPYFESINWGVICVLSLFQIVSLYKNPYLTIPYIAKKLNYLNFTLTFLTTFFFIMRSTNDSDFAWIMNCFFLAISISMCLYAYLIGIQDKKIRIARWTEYLAFRTLYSMLLPLLLIEFASLLINPVNTRKENTSEELKILIFISLIFAIGLILTLLKEFTIVFSIIYYLLGIFSIQLRETCKYSYGKCSPLIQLLCGIYSIFLGIFLVIFHKYRKKNIQSISSINSSK